MLRSIYIYVPLQFLRFSQHNAQLPLQLGGECLQLPAIRRTINALQLLFLMPQLEADVVQTQESRRAFDAFVFGQLLLEGGRHGVRVHTKLFEAHAFLVVCGGKGGRGRNVCI